MSLFNNILRELIPPIFVKIFHSSRSDNTVMAKGRPVLDLEKIGPKTLSLSVGRPMFSVPVYKIRYDGGLPYDKEHHHFLKYYVDGITALHEYYQSHQPENIFEKHFLPVPKEYYSQFKLEQIKKTTGIKPWLYHLDPEADSGIHGELGLGKEHGNQAHGPVTEKKIALEAHRLDKILHSIEKNGFKPEQFDGYPRGYFLIDKSGDWVFLVRTGFHRVAALIHLGHTHIPFEFQRKYPRVIYQADCAEWHAVKEGLLTKLQASDIFMQYFKVSEKWLRNK